MDTDTTIVVMDVSSEISEDEEKDEVQTMHECAICFEKYDETELYNARCGHVLHLPCMKEHAIFRFRNRLDFTCPLCRNTECAVHEPAYNQIRQAMIDEGVIPNEVVLNINRHILYQGRRHYPTYMNYNCYCSMVCGLIIVWSLFIGFVTFALIYTFTHGRK